MHRFGEDMGEDDRNMKGNVRAAIQVDSASDFLASLRTPTNVYICCPRQGFRQIEIPYKHLRSNEHPLIQRRLIITSIRLRSQAQFILIPFRLRSSIELRSLLILAMPREGGASTEVAIHGSM
jgi:hypothetical protein